MDPPPRGTPFPIQWATGGDAAQSDRVDPVDPGLDHYAVGLYATRVRELEAAWTAYRRAEGR